MDRSMARLGLLFSCVAAAALSACGGGGSDAPAPVPVPPPPPAASTVTVSGRAADGPLQGAKVCYDANDNGACDDGEPAATSGADGSYSLTVDAAAAGQHRVVVEVSADTVDADVGAAVGTAYTLIAPPTGAAGDQSVFVSPLTTLVQRQMEATGASRADAAALVQQQAGLALTVFDDYVAASGDGAVAARSVARVLQAAVLQQAQALADAVGQTDASGAAVTAADVEKAAAQALVQGLPSIAVVAADPALASATGADLQAKVTAAAAAVVAQTGLTTDEVIVQIGIGKLPAETAAPSPPAASALLDALRYTDVDNWYARTIEGSVADQTPDANHKTRYYTVRKQSAGSNFSPNGVVTAWNYNNDPARAGDLHWDGTTWSDCPLFQRNESTVRDANGFATYTYCGVLEVGSSQRKAVDVSGQSIASVVRDTIRKYPGGNSGVNYADWGPADLSAFGAATFPSGSQLYYQTNTTTSTAIAYDVRPSNVVAVFSADVAAGGDARANASLACAASATPTTTAATLEDVVARNPGQPCIFAKNTGSAPDVSLDPNEWWSNSTVSLGVLAGATTQPAGTGNWYTTSLRLRVAFAATGNGTTYWSCYERAGSGSSRNCTSIGTGTYAIQTLGDARAMTFTGLPPQASALGYARVLVERGGAVYFGYKNNVGRVGNLLRLNTAATSAVLDQLGLPPVQPVTRASDLDAASAAEAATAQGVWGANDDNSAVVFRFGPNGTYLMGEAGPPKTDTREQSGAELGFWSIDAATGRVSGLQSTDSTLTAGLSNPKADDPAVTITADAIQSGGETIALRMPGDGTGIVGLWALGSATELNTQHFAFFPNGKVLMIDPLGDTSGGQCTIDRQGPPGAEYASYTYDAVTGALRVFGKIYDTNGCAGLFDSSTGNPSPNTEANFVVTLSGDGKTATVTADGETSTLYRIPTR